MATACAPVAGSCAPKCGPAPTPSSPSPTATKGRRSRSAIRCPVGHSDYVPVSECRRKGDPFWTSGFLTSPEESVWKGHRLPEKRVVQVTFGDRAGDPGESFRHHLRAH